VTRQYPLHEGQTSGDDVQNTDLISNGATSKTEAVPSVNFVSAAIPHLDNMRARRREKQQWRCRFDRHCGGLDLLGSVSVAPHGVRGDVAGFARTTSVRYPALAI
jgi:hypothetical protein